MHCPTSHFRFLTKFLFLFNQICKSSPFHVAISLIPLCCLYPRPTCAISFCSSSTLCRSLILQLISTMQPLSIAFASQCAPQESFAALIIVTITFAISCCSSLDPSHSVVFFARLLELSYPVGIAPIQSTPALHKSLFLDDFPSRQALIFQMTMLFIACRIPISVRVPKILSSIFF